MKNVFSTPRPHVSSSQVDLHTHSNYSDGLLSPAALVTEAAARGIRVLALTDHDTVAGLPEARAAGERHGVEVIAGVELSTMLASGEGIHLLGYLFDSDDPELRAGLATYARAREERMARMIERLAAAGAPVDAEQVRSIAGHGTMGRPHLARAMVAAGHVADVPDAFARYLGRGRPAYVPRPRVDPSEAIALIGTAGGVTVMAHPFASGDVESVIDRLVPMGLAGLEVDYGQYTPDQREFLRSSAARRGLVATGGSDFHGPGLGAGRELGIAPVPFTAVAALQAARAARLPSPGAAGSGEPGTA